jgi:integrase/recombinase XerD
VAGLEGIRCSPRTLRHTGAKRLILAGGDVFTLQKLQGQTMVVMVRRYVELADVDVKAQHQPVADLQDRQKEPATTQRSSLPEALV